MCGHTETLTRMQSVNKLPDRMNAPDHVLGIHFGDLAVLLLGNRSRDVEFNDGSSGRAEKY